MKNLTVLLFGCIGVWLSSGGCVFAQETEALETIKVHKCIQPVVLADSLKNRVFRIAAVSYTGDDRCNATRLFAIHLLEAGNAVYLDGREVLECLNDICENCGIRTVCFSVDKVEENRVWIRFSVR